MARDLQEVKLRRKPLLERRLGLPVVSLTEITSLMQGEARPRMALSNDPGKVDSSFFCYAATVLSTHRNVLICTQRMYEPT